MLEYNGKEFRNLEDQVGYLTAAFNSGKLIDELGIKVLGVLPDLITAKETIRRPYEYGDALEIGTEKPYNLYIYTRNIEDFFDFGPFPAPGPKGDLGPTPSISINANVTNTTGTPEATVTKTGTDEAPVFNFTFKNIKGERGQTGMQGVRGFEGPRGYQGPIGPRGLKGEKGDTGPAFKLLGDLTSTSQLPTPTVALQAKGSAYTIPNAQGIKHIWVIQGTDNLLWVDIGVSGVQGPKGDPGTGINDLQSVVDIGTPGVIYNSNKGIIANSVERYTYGDREQVDVPTQRKIPLIAGEGISIDAPNGTNKAIIKTLNTNLINGTGTDSIVQKYSGQTDETHFGNISEGESGAVFGEANSNSGNRAIVSGKMNRNSAPNSLIIGLGNGRGIGATPNINALSGEQLFVFGNLNSVSNGDGNIVLGVENTLSDVRYTTIIGRGNIINNTSLYEGKCVVGRYNNQKSDTMFEVGVGDYNNRVNGLEVLKEGTIRVPNFDSNGNRIGMVTLKVVNGSLQITTYPAP